MGSYSRTIVCWLFEGVREGGGAAGFGGKSGGKPGGFWWNRASAGDDSGIRGPKKCTELRVRPQKRRRGAVAAAEECLTRSHEGIRKMGFFTSWLRAFV